MLPLTLFLCQMKLVSLTVVEEQCSAAALWEVSKELVIYCSLRLLFEYDANQFGPL